MQDNRTRNDLRIHIMDISAGTADIALMRVAVRDSSAELDRQGGVAHRLSRVEFRVLIILTRKHDG
jgi:hypothetical protein